MLFLMAVTGGAFAQRNIAGAGIGAMIGTPYTGGLEVFASYEFFIIPQFSLGANLTCQLYPLVAATVIFGPIVGLNEKYSAFTYIAEGQVHWYPHAKTFHVDLGVGYANYLSNMRALLIAPGFGWTFYAKPPKGFLVNFSFRGEVFMPLSGFVFEPNENGSFIPFNILTVQAALGYRF